MASNPTVARFLQKRFKNRRLTVDATSLGVSTAKLEDIINGELTLTTAMAVAICKVVGGKPAKLMAAQVDDELAHLEGTIATRPTPTAPGVRDGEPSRSPMGPPAPPKAPVFSITR